MGGKRATDQAGLGHVNAVRVLGQQGERLFALVLALSGGLGVLEQFGANQRSALGVEDQLEHVGGHHMARGDRAGCASRGFTRCAGGGR
ncbi:hypothetical protein D9M68_878160 [compost metagenome]